PAAGLPQFVRELDQRAQTQHTPEVNGVTLASLHAAKGLEWEVVFLAGLADGTLPIQHADTPEAVEEERRLLYVGSPAHAPRWHCRGRWRGTRADAGRAGAAGSSPASHPIHPAGRADTRDDAGCAAGDCATPRRSRPADAP